MQAEKDLLNDDQDNDFKAIWEAFKLKVFYMQIDNDVTTHLFTNTLPSNELKNSINVSTSSSEDVIRAAETFLWVKLDPNGNFKDAPAYNNWFFKKR